MLVFVFHLRRSRAYKVNGSVAAKQAQRESMEEGAGDREWRGFAKDTVESLGVPQGAPPPTSQVGPLRPGTRSHLIGGCI